MKSKIKNVFLKSLFFIFLVNVNVCNAEWPQITTQVSRQNLLQTSLSTGLYLTHNSLLQHV